MGRNQLTWAINKCSTNQAIYGIKLKLTFKKITLKKFKTYLDTNRNSSNTLQHSSNAALSVKYKNDNDNKAKFDKRRQKKKKEIRAAAVLGIIVLSFTICWLPLHILNTIYR